MPTATQLRQWRAELAHLLREVPGVGGVAITWDPSGERCLRVNVEFGFPFSDRIPTTFRGLPVSVQTAEPAHLQSPNETRTRAAS